MPFIDPVRIPMVGHAVIDRAHQDLVKRINALYELWQQQAPRSVLATESALLLRAFGRHFAEEEALVADLNFEGLATHQARHQELLADLSDKIHCLSEQGETQAETIVDVFAAIDQMLYEHEIIDDQEFWGLFATPHEVAQAGPRETGEILSLADVIPTGLGPLDQQHQELVMVVNRLGGLLAVQAPAAVIQGVLNEILSHTIEHFAYEEAVSKQHALSDHHVHTEMHNELVKNLEDLINRYAEGHFEGIEEVFRRYLKFWLIDHIVHVDAPMVQALLKHEVEV
jgi:hemerythrin-like metal-binding protein